MASRIADKTLIWSGEHWVAYLRNAGEETDIGAVSLYNTRYSPVGGGTVAFIDIPGQNGFPAICAERHDLADFIFDTMIRGRGMKFDAEIPVIKAKIDHGGDVRKAPWWSIATEHGTVKIVWSQVLPPLILEGSGPVFDNRSVTYSLLFFTTSARITLDGEATGGEPYTRDIWRRAIGRPGSSCVFALAETITEI